MWARALFGALALTATLLGGERAAIACGPPPPPMIVDEVLGWTRDGRQVVFAYRASVGAAWMSEKAGFAGGSFVGVLDVQAERTQRFAIKVSAEYPNLLAAAERKRYRRWKALPGTRALASWRAKHPLVRTPDSRRCGNAEIRAKLSDVHGFRDRKPSGHWKGRLFSYRARPAAVLELGVKRGGHVFKHAELLQVEDPRWGGPFRVGFSWSPACRRIAWWFSSLGRDKNPFSSAWDHGFHARNLGPLVVKPVGPVVHVRGLRTRRHAAIRVAEALTKAGYPAHVGRLARLVRKKSVVYAWAGVRDLAAGVARAIPGGAKVEPLTWAAKADIVVAVGESAASTGQP